MTQQPVPIEQAAAILGTTSSAIRKRIKRGTLTATKGEGGRWMIFLPVEGATTDSPEATRTLPDDSPEGQDAGQPGGYPQDGTSAGSLPAEILARLAALEAENAAIREALAETRKDRDAWHDQAQQAQAATDRAPQALPDGSNTAADPAGRRRRWWQFGKR